MKRKKTPHILCRQMMRITDYLMCESWKNGVPPSKEVRRKVLEKVKKIEAIYVRYVDNIYKLHKLEIDGIDALQWTSGDAGPDGTLPDWDVIYDKAIAAGKSIWVKVYSGEFEDWIKNVDRIVKKYGSHSLFLLFPEMSLEQAAYLLDYADKNWSDVKGTYVESLGR